jgi:HD superfamily phosphohydrolase
MYSPDQPLSRLFSPQLRSALEYTIPSFDDLTFSHHLGPENQRTHIGQIVDGPIDADKVDYLVRDGNACGISYANGIDIERLLDSIRLVQSRDARHLGVSIKGLASASELYYTRFHMYAEVYYHKVSRSIAAATKRAFLRVIDHRAPDPLQLVEVLLRSSELQVVDYLLEQLRKIEQGRYAPMLDDPFGRNGRKLLKRIRTYSDVWLQNADRSQERVVLDILREQAMSFRNVGLLETAICDKLDSSGLMPKDSRACILVDVPPPKNISRFPFVVDARGISYLNQANPVVESAAVAQRTSQRVRIFASRATHEALQRKYPRSDSLDRYLDERIVEAVQSIRLASQS